MKTDYFQDNLTQNNCTLFPPSSLLDLYLRTHQIQQQKFQVHKTIQEEVSQTKWKSFLPFCLSCFLTPRSCFFISTKYFPKHKVIPN